jgi:hypothetical protein
VLALILARPDLTARTLEQGVQVPRLREPFKLSAGDFATEAQSSIFLLLREHPGESIESVLSDERSQGLIDRLFALGAAAEEILLSDLYSSEASIREAFLRLGILSRERSKNEIADYDEKEALRSDIQVLKEALRAVSVEP